MGGHYGGSRKGSSITSPSLELVRCVWGASFFTFLIAGGRLGDTFLVDPSEARSGHDPQNYAPFFGRKVFLSPQFSQTSLLAQGVALLVRHSHRMEGRKKVVGDVRAETHPSGLATRIRTLWRNHTQLRLVLWPANAGFELFSTVPAHQANTSRLRARLSCMRNFLTETLISQRSSQQGSIRTVLEGGDFTFPTLHWQKRKSTSEGEEGSKPVFPR